VLVFFDFFFLEIALGLGASWPLKLLMAPPLITAASMMVEIKIDNLVRLRTAKHVVNKHL
jgi:hypothetical protein